MILIQTIGTVDAKHKLPAPRQFVAVSVVWGILFLMADTAAKQIAARLAVLIVLTGMVVGPFGKVAVGFLNKISKDFQPAQTLRNKFATAPDAPEDTGSAGGTVI